MAASPAANPCRAHGCAACCYETQMPVLEEDAKRLETRGFARADFTVVDENGILSLRNVDATTEGGKKHCFFLKDDLCSVYSDRPTGCRLYPFVLDEHAKRVVRDVDCPWRREFSQDAGVGRRLLVAWNTVSREADGRAR